MRFCTWRPLAEAAADAPAAPGVYQVRVGSGLIDYPTGKSAMVHYGAADDVAAAIADYAARHPDRPWLCRHAAQTEPDRHLARLLARFEQQFGLVPTPPLASFKLRVADGHARLVYADGAVADVEGDALASLLSDAAPLMAYVTAACPGTVRAVSVIRADRVLRATYDGDDGVGVLRVDGDAFDRDVAPLCHAVRGR